MKEMKMIINNKWTSLARLSNSKQNLPKVKILYKLLHRADFFDLHQISDSIYRPIRSNDPFDLLTFDLMVFSI